MNIIKAKWKEARIFSRTFLKWLWISALIGLVGGVIGCVFYKSIAFVTDLRAASPWLIWLLPVGGLVIAALYQFTHTKGESTNDIIDSILLGNKVDILLLPVIFLSTVLTHLLGGSAGREGAALQIGGSLGYNTGRLLKLDEKEERIAILSGMSAVFSALFGTPVTATVFALEVCSVGILHYSGLVPCGVAALSAYYVTTLFRIAPTHFVISPLAVEPLMVIRVALLAILCAVLSVVFCEVMHASNHLAEKAVKNDYLRAFLGGCVIIGLTFLVGSREYNGGGTDIIARAIYEGRAHPAAFLLKMLFTAVTLSAGFKGGEIVPTFFIGSTFGCVLGPFLGIPPEFAACVGLVGTFCGAVNCPLASVILSVELFGSDCIIYFSIVCFICYMLSGYSGLYSEQKIIYSKLKAEYINIKTD
ncbi:MAG: chloride channel protein [Oscillospiraceae bacterium]|nr:chloride channel protein [Oscillospiraceae bacterium]